MTGSDVDLSSPYCTLSDYLEVAASRLLKAAN